MQGKKEEQKPSEGGVQVARVEVIDAGLVDDGGDGADDGEGNENDMDGDVQGRAGNGEHNGDGKNNDEGKEHQGNVGEQERARVRGIEEGSGVVEEKEVSDIEWMHVHGRE